VLELAFPRTAEAESASMPVDPYDVVNLGWHELWLAASMTVERTGDGAAGSDLSLPQLPAAFGADR
jgi:hypothetical protein